ASASIGPSRTTLGAGPVKSKTVEGRWPGGWTPAGSTRYTATESPKASTIGSGSSSGGRPEMFALVAARGPAKRRMASEIGSAGTRTPIEASRFPRYQGAESVLLVRTSVSGPGQKLAARAAAAAVGSTRENA